MIGKRLSHFRILEKIGEGGMGVVYKALDENLGRNVALKVLQPGAVGDESRRLRFMREARAAAAVTHPHIATIHEIDEADGNIFIAMELVEGETLDLFPHGHPLSPRDGLRIAIEIAEALARAHGAGVVHRDLKPQNIIIGPDRHAKVLDFGLAKLLDPADPGDPEHAAEMRTISAEMTQEGKVLGTASYMSPEQARGLAVDPRSDVFSFGVLLYEMFAGKLPFRGATVTDTLSAILRDAQAPVSQQNPQVTPELERIVDKCLEKNPEDRYQHVDDIVVDLRRLRRETDSVPIPRAGDTGGVSVVSSKSLRQRPTLIVGAIAVLAVVVVAVFALLRSGGLMPFARADVSGLAVLPFQNLSAADDPQRMGQILQELIITDLSELQSVTVFSSQRLLDLRKQIGDGDSRLIDPEVATRVAQRAGAERMLTGSLSRLGSQWILTSQLVNVSDGSVVKSERIDGGDLYSMVDDLTSRLRANLGLDDATVASASVKDKTTDSMEAYEHYLAGLDHINDVKYDKAIEELAKAVEIDPKFGQAYYKLAIARWWNDDASSVPVDPEEAERTLERALADDVKLSARDRKLAQAFLPLIRHDYLAALPGFEQLVQELPDEKEAWYGLGEVRWHSPGGASDPASAEPFEQALALDPSFHMAYSHVRTVYRRNAMHDHAIGKVRELIEKSPQDPWWYARWVEWLAMKGDAVAVESAIDEAFDRIVDPADRRDLLVKAGDGFAGLEQRDRAAAYFRRALDIPGDKGKKVALVRLGWQLRWDHDYREAEKVFNEALDLDPLHSGALWGAFRLLEAEGRFDEAVLKARGLLAGHPEAIQPYRFWISSAVQKGDEQESSRAIEQALGHNPDASRKKWVWMAASDAYADIGHTTKQAKFAEMAYQAMPAESDNQMMNDLGWSKIATRDYDAARTFFERSLTSFENPRAVAGLGRVALLQGDYEGAIREAERFWKIQPDQAWSRAVVVAMHLFAGDRPRAEERFEELLDSIPTDPMRSDFVIVVADANIAVREFERAGTLLEQAAALDPEARDRFLLRTQAWFALQQGRYDGAADHVESMLALAPADTDALLLMARLDLLRGDARKAERGVRDLIARGPASLEAREILAVALAEQGRFDEARNVAEQCLTMHSDWSTNGLLAWILVAGDLDLERGIELALAGQAIPLDPWDVSTLWPARPSPEHALGLAYLKQGRFDEAVVVLEEAARLRPGRTAILEHLESARARRPPG